MAVAALCVAIAGIYVLNENQRHHMETRLTDRMVGAANVIANEASASESPEELQRFVASLAHLMRMETIVVAGGDPLVVIASSEPKWFGRPLTDLPDPEHVRHDLERVHRSGQPQVDLDHGHREHLIDYTFPLDELLGRKSVGGRPAGVAMMHLDADALYQRQRSDTLRLGLGAVASAFALCMGLFLLLERSVLAPLTRLCATVAAIRSGDRAARARLSRSDEFGRLGDLLDETLDQLDHFRECEQVAMTHALDAANRAEQIATTDTLTGLANRRRAIETLETVVARARAKNEFGYAVLFLDFDGFKRINDALGHEVGDKLLVEIANRLQLRVSEGPLSTDCGGLVARLGGDEFVVLLEQLEDARLAERIAEDLVSLFETPLEVGSHELRVSVSIGVAPGAERYTRADELLRDADTTMYVAKRRGKGQCVVFDATMRERVVRQQRLDADLRKAIGTEQIWLAYQPIVSLATGEIKSVEALARWRHPTLGDISPVEFIPLGEESDVIIEFGRWVLQAGCRQMAQWVQELGPAAPPSISLNVSRRQFQHAKLTSHIREALDDAELKAARLQIEITEDMYAGDLPTALRAMGELKQLGISLAIDDFGVGASAFASLHQFPVDVLKIDRLLLTEIERSRDTAALVHSLAILARNLDISIVAEGVEGAGQVIALQNLGCQYGQGFYFARPLPAADMERLLIARHSANQSVHGASAFGNQWSERLTAFEPIDIQSSNRRS